MKLRVNPLKSAATHTHKATTIPRLACQFFICGLLAACRPAPDTTPTPRQKESPPPPAAAPSVVSIPEEFLSPQPKPSVLPRVVFATSDFQVTTRHGIQGIHAGEAVNFLREEGGDYVVESDGLEFKKNKSFFAATYVEPARPEPTPFSRESPPVAQRASSPEPLLPDEPPLSGPVPADDPALIAEEKKLGDLTASIRTLNERIRSAQDELDKKSTRTSGGEAPSAQEIKKDSRAIQKLKDQRDQLSGQLTRMGKP